MLDRIRVYIKSGDTVPKFLSIIARYIPKLTRVEQELITKACFLVEREFKDDYRHTGEAYITHFLAVATIIVCHLGMRDVNLIIAAILHDLLEDKPHWTRAHLVEEFNADVADLVYSVTKQKRQPSESFHEYELKYFAQVRAGRIRSVILKLSDRLHNMLTLWGSPEKKKAKTFETLQYLLPLAVEFQILWAELTLACTERINEENFFNH